MPSEPLDLSAIRIEAEEAKRSWLRRDLVCGLAARVLALCAEVERLRLRWTDELPTVPGWYWFRARNAHVVGIYLLSGGAIESCFGNEWRDPDDPLFHGGQWAGPIPQPEDA